MNGKLFLIVLPLLFILACKSFTNTNINHPGYLDSVMIRAQAGLWDSSHYFTVLNAAYKSIKNPGTNDQWDKYFIAWRYFYYKTKNFPKALLYTDTLLSVSRGAGRAMSDTVNYAKSLFLRGDILLGQHHYDEAFDWYYQAREIIFQTADSCYFSEYTTRLANVSYRQEKYIDAAGYFKLGLAEQSQCTARSPFDLFVNTQGTLDNIAICYSRKGMADSAQLYFDKALGYISEHEKEFPQRADFVALARAVIQGNKADMEIERRNYSLAEQLLKESIAMTEQPKHAPEDAVYSRIKLIKLYLDQSRLPETNTLLQVCGIAMDTIRNADLSATLYRLQSRYYIATNKPLQAYYAVVRYMKIKDSLAADAVPATDIHNEFENIDRKSKLQLLEQKTRLQTIYLIILVLGCLMGAAIILLILKNSKQSRRHIKALTQTLEALEKSQEENSRLMKVVAHDLRNPIGAITSYIGIILDEQKDHPDYQMLQLMYRSGNNSLDLINDLLHIQPTISVFSTEPLDIGELLHYCVTLLQHKASEKRQQIVLHAPHTVIPGNREKLWRVFSNLISNAIKFSPENAVISVSLQTLNHSVCVSVQDNGIGIPEKLQGEIFSLSQKAKRKGTAGEQSFGLGLVISRQIIERHSGKIWFESVVGMGTTFYVELPLK